MPVDNKALCLGLVRAESEEEVIKILQKAGYWQNEDEWHNFGDNENNFSTIGNQQSRADSALVEKLINSVDAVLLREAYRKGIKPQDSSAPQSTALALEQLFNIPEGKLTSLSAAARSALAKNIKLVATGSKKNPNYIVADTGEGQSPNDLPDTFLSLNKSNKLRIPFVQGKFNMGGTGSLQFCGEHNLQLILSRRDPKSIINSGDDNLWGFTIIRRENPDKGVRSSVFKYLRPKGAIPSFKANSLPILPGQYPNAYSEPMEYGSYVKLFDFKLNPKGLKTNVKFDLYYRLSSLLPNIALPVAMFERRKGYAGQNYEAVLSGLGVRLEEDKASNLEEGFPSSSEVNIQGEKMPVSVYAFKKGKRENYTKNDGVLFTYNGQTHGFMNKSFFDRKYVDMSYLADSILVFVDCAQISGRTREDLFMNSRDRLREGPLLSAIEKEIGSILNGHPGLRALRESRRRDELNKNLADSKPLAETLENIIKQSPSLSSLFILGSRIASPFDLTGAGETEKFEGKLYPTYFKLSSKGKNKKCPINHGFRVPFETDAENEYFKRDENPGTFQLLINDVEASDYSYNLWNGKAVVNLTLPSAASVGQKFEYKVIVDDPRQMKPFENSFNVEVDEPTTYKPGPGPKPPKPPSDEDGTEKTRPASLALPNITEVHKKDWGDHEFGEYSALKIMSYENKYDFFINVDNSYLLNEIRVNPKLEPEIIKVRFVNAIVLISLALLSKFEQAKDTDGGSPFDQIAKVAEAVAPIVCPMIDKLGSLS